MEFRRPQLLEDMAHLGDKKDLTPQQREALADITKPQLLEDVYVGMLPATAASGAYHGSLSRYVD